MLLTSDPHAWLRPYFATLKADPAFNMLAIPLRFAALRELVELEHPDRARSMREWSPEAQSSTLKWLDSSTKEKIRCHRAVTLDRDQGHEGMRCVARYLPIGD